MKDDTAYYSMPLSQMTILKRKPIHYNSISDKDPLHSNGKIFCYLDTYSISSLLLRRFVLSVILLISFKCIFLSGQWTSPVIVFPTFLVFLQAH